MPEDRWAKVKEFIAEWFEPLGEGDGYSEEEIAFAEARLGIRLPEALREWYGFAGKWFLRNQVQDHQLSLSQLEWQNEALVFHAENQWAFEWAIRRDNFAIADPPIFEVINNTTICKTTSNFLLRTLFKEAIFGASPKINQGSCSLPRENLQDILGILRAKMKTIHEESKSFYLFGNTNAIVTCVAPDDQETWIEMGTRSENARKYDDAILGNAVTWG